MSERRRQRPPPKKEPAPLISPLVTNAIAVVVTVVWSMLMVASVLSEKFNPHPSVHAIMLALVGGAFGISIVRRNGK